MIHFLLKGHWPVWVFRPISDYLNWRVCERCEKKKT